MSILEDIVTAVRIGMVLRTRDSTPPLRKEVAIKDEILLTPEDLNREVREANERRIDLSDQIVRRVTRLKRNVLNETMNRNAIRPGVMRGPGVPDFTADVIRPGRFEQPMIAPRTKAFSPRTVSSLGM